MTDLTEFDSRNERALHICLAVTGGGFVVSALLFGSLTAIDLVAVSRMLVVALLCVMTARGANWARLLLGVFLLPNLLLLLLSFVRTGSLALLGWLVFAMLLVASGTYLALWFHPRVASAFARRRNARAASPVAAP